MRLGNSEGLFIVISGPSGVGKGSLCKKLVKQFDGYFSVSATTREKRDGETEGVDYYYLTKEEFEEKIRNNDFLEYATYGDNYYGTLKSMVVSKLDTNKCVFAEIEINGARKIKELYNDSILIYIMPPSLEELEDRLRNRNTEDRKAIEKRMMITKKEMSESLDFYDYVVVNDDFDETFELIKDIIEKEK